MRQPARGTRAALASALFGLGVVAALANAGCSSQDTGACSGGSCTTTTTGSGDAGLGGSGGSGGHAGQGGTGGWVDVDSGPPPFTPGHVFIAGSRNAEVFEYDSSLALVTRWTNDGFGTINEQPPGQDLQLGPAGMAFDASGYLVVAARDEFCVFKGPNDVLACHPKTQAEPTENIIFDLDGNLYTTTATGGTDHVQKYDSSYTPVTTFSLPTSQLTGVTCDPDGNLFVASQTGATSIIYKVDKTDFTVLDQIPIDGTVEGLQLAQNGNILVGLDAGMGIVEVHASSPTVVVNTIANAELTWAVPVTTDNDGNIYTADYENGSGTAFADMFVFDPTGGVIAARLPSEVLGPFGMVVGGAVLPCGAYQPPR